MKEILDLVQKYIEEKDSTKEWKAGEDWVQYAGPYFTSEEYVKGVESLLKGWLAMGGDSIKFEKRFPENFGRDYGVLTNSGSSANLLMMAAMTSKRLYNFPKGTKVIVPVAGFPTTVNPIYQFGFEPVFVDIEIDTLNLNIEQVKDAAKNTDAKIITFAHVLGNPPNMDEVMQVVKEHDLILLEDCCDALGSTYKDKPLGSFGEMASCSFFPAHHITMGEGGFVATRTAQQEKVVRSFREWGRGCFCVGRKANLSKKGSCGCRFSNWISALPEEIFDHKFVYEEIGFNLKPVEMQSSMGLVQLDKLPEIHERRKENYKNLYNVFEKYEEHLHLPKATKNSDPSWFSFPMTIKDGSPFKRRDITGFLEDNKIQTRTYFAGNILLQPAYSHLNDIEDTIKRYPVATKVTKDTFFIGASPVITKQQIDYIQSIVDKFFQNL
jgi:CDP-4-dehydro-6-deoxyglucose reductase, E1